MEKTKCCEYGNWGRNQNKSFSPQLTNGHNMLETYITLSKKYTNPIDFWGPFESFMKNVVFHVKMIPGTLFTTLHFICSLLMGQISLSVTIHLA
jgi:hypothetical protein